MNIYVGNLPFSTTDETLHSYFAPYGEVTSARVITDKMSGRSRGFGFVEMASDSDAASAIQALNGRDMMGRPLTVNEARPREERPRDGGGFRGGDGGGFRGGDGGGRQRY